MVLEMFIDFIKAHYELIGAVLLVLLSLFLQLMKKKPIINKMAEIKARILEVLPGLIDSVEVEGQGSSKKILVLKSIQLLLAKEFKVYDFTLFEDFVSDAIENILICPQKK